MSNAKVNQIKDMTDYQGVCIVAHQEKRRQFTNFI